MMAKKYCIIFALIVLCLSFSCVAMVPPVYGTVQEGFSSEHEAIDIFAPLDTPVYAAADGVVEEIRIGSYRYDGDAYGAGNYVVLRHQNLNPELWTKYLHLNQVLVTSDESVSAGQQVGTIGNTGNTIGPTGYHLHFEIREGSRQGTSIDPLRYINFYILDSTHPTVQAFQVTPQSLARGELFIIEYSVSDTGGSGLNRVELWRKDERDDWQEIERDTLAGENGPLSGSFTDSPSVSGKYWYGVHVVDNAGNWNDEKNSNTNKQPSSFEPVEVEVNEVVSTTIWRLLNPADFL